MLIYVIKERDTVDSIAAAYGISPEAIIYNNQLIWPYPLTVGQAILLPTAEGQQSTKRTVYVGGYAYPFISPYVLSQTLPFLSYLYIFSYGFTKEGSLIPPLVDDTWMITMAKNYGVAPVLTLTPFGVEGTFDNRLISAVVNNPMARENLKNEIVGQISGRGFEGLDIDFEYILAQDRQAFVDFVDYMQEAVGSLGFPVSVALAPKSSAGQRGLLYEGKDYAALGAVADYVLLMTYEWGYTYGPPMAVAPLDKVRQVVEYAITEIPPGKIHLGIPNYGYDWSLPFVRGVTRAETLGNIQAVQRAIEYGVPVSFDEPSKSPYYLYRRENVEHEVWFQDVRSMDATFALLDEYRLRGAGYWNIMQLFRANWLLLGERFEVY